MPTPEQIQDAARRIAATPKKLGEWLPFITRNGHYVWSHSYGVPGCGDDDAAFRAFGGWVTALPNDDPYRQQLVDMLTVPSVCHELMSDALWVDQGCPIVQTSHKFAAAAICTRLPPDLELRTPWRAWVLEVPDRLLTLTDPATNREIWIRYCLVRLSDTQHWSLTGMCSNNYLQIGSRNQTAEGLLAADPGVPDDQRTVLDWDLDTETERVIVCLKRLVCNLLCAMSEHNASATCAPVGIHRPTSHASLRAGVAPQHRRFVIRSDVAIDLRQEVSRYCRGERRGSAPTVQTLVRGHYHTVLTGKGKSTRELRWYQPYWRGPLEAPIKSPTVKVE